MGCVVGLQICPSETPRLSSEASPSLISLTIARWNFSFVGLGLTRIESFGSQLGGLILIQLFCRVQVFLANLDSHVAYTKTVLSKQPSHHQLRCFRKLRHYHPSWWESTDAWSRRQLYRNHHRIQRCVSAELLMKMCLLGLVFEWHNHAGLENHYSDYFQQLKRLCLNL